MIVRALAAVGLLACAQPLGAQVASTVVTGAAPLPRVVVSLWNASREVARDTTDASGRFGFAASVAHDASGLALRRLGFVARTLSVRPGDVALRPAMVQVAQPLPAAVVAATKERPCARKDDPAARALWNATRSTYAVSPHGMSVLADVAEHARHDVDASAVGDAGDGRRTPYVWRTYTVAMRQYWDALARDGYAVRRALPKPGQELIRPEYLHWWYAPVHRELVEHLVEDGFARAHVFAPVASSVSTRSLAFCPRDTKRPGLEGVAELDDAGALQRITWRWRTPKPDEDAGAELLFVPPARADARRLVPARIVYWRHLAGRKDRYYQEVMINRAWFYVPHDHAPTGSDRVSP